MIDYKNAHNTLIKLAARVNAELAVMGRIGKKIKQIAYKAFQNCKRKKQSCFIKYT